MKNKILLGIFLAGVLLTGIGVGIAFGEYSDFTYGGEVLIGNEREEVETKDYIISLGEKKTRVSNFTYTETDFVVDKKLKDGQVRVEVITNPDYVKSYHYYEDYKNTDYAPEYVADYEGEIQIHLGTEQDFVYRLVDKENTMAELFPQVVADRKVLRLKPNSSVLITADESKG